MTGWRLNHTCAYGVALSLLLVVTVYRLDANTLSTALKSDTPLSQRCQVESQELWLVDKKLEGLLADALNLGQGHSSNVLTFDDSPDLLIQVGIASDYR